MTISANNSEPEYQRELICRTYYCHLPLHFFSCNFCICSMNKRLWTLRWLCWVSAIADTKQTFSSSDNPAWRKSFDSKWNWNHRDRPWKSNLRWKEMRRAKAAQTDFVKNGNFKAFASYSSMMCSDAWSGEINLSGVCLDTSICY